MNNRNVLSIVILVVILNLAKLPVLARETQLTEPLTMQITNASIGTNTSWINREIDTGNSGQYTSISVDPNNSGIHISY